MVKGFFANLKTWNLARAMATPRLKAYATNQIPMPKLPQCDTCTFCAHHYALVCVPYPNGPDGDDCSDFALDPSLHGKQFRDFLGINDEIDNPWHPDPEENWAPDGWAYVNGELVRQPSQFCEVDS